MPGKVTILFLADIIGVPASRRASPGTSLYDQILNYRGTVSFGMVHGEPRLRLA